MKQLTGTKASYRLLELNVSAKDGGMTPRESRKWGLVATKIIATIADYDDQVQELIAAARGVDALSAEERRREVARLNAEITALDEGVGQEEVTLVLESEEWRLVDEIWWTLKFAADRVTRERIERVSLMIESAVEVKIEGDHVVPIERSEKANGRPKSRALARR